MSQWETQLRKGVVELAVLASLGDGEAYGYRIVERLRSLPGLALTESTVYPVLARLARDSFLAVRAEQSPAGPTRALLSAHGRRPASVPANGGKLEDGFGFPFRID